jgi:ABC-type sugar transport system permease subunit
MLTITALSQTLHLWIRRLRLQRALTWAARGLIVGLAFALALGSIGLYQAELLRREFLALVIFTPLLISFIAALIAFLWLSNLSRRRCFDQRFGLNVSTALELGQRPANVPPEMIDRQLQDAVARPSGKPAP